MRLAALMQQPHHLRDDPRLHRARRGWPDPSAGRASGQRCARCPTCACSAPPMRSRPPSAGSSRWSGRTARRCWRCPGRTSRRCADRACRDNRCAHGAYELVAANGEAKVSIFATGSEVEIAVAAQQQLSPGAASRRGWFRCPAGSCCSSRPEAIAASHYRQRAGQDRRRGGCRASGWDAVIGAGRASSSACTSFGHSAPAKDLYKHFGITAEPSGDAPR